jgi:hypothetical protein
MILFSVREACFLRSVLCVRNLPPKGGNSFYEQTSEVLDTLRAVKYPYFHQRRENGIASIFGKARLR